MVFQVACRLETELKIIVNGFLESLSQLNNFRSLVAYQSANELQFSVKNLIVIAVAELSWP
jgi:hypothetical protein